MAEAQVVVGPVNVLGIDEAGRGAVLGPFVVAGVMVQEERLPQLLELGARDSKRVPRERRRGILRRIVRLARVRAVVISASQVDGESLTELELRACARLIRGVLGAGGEGLSPRLTVVLDAPTAPAAIPGFLARLSHLAGVPPEALSAYPKADTTHPAVAAASLAAKVVRDAYVAFLRSRYGDFGWGYPGERRVREFLEGWLARHGELPPICRSRWRSVARLARPDLFPGG